MRTRFRHIAGWLLVLLAVALTQTARSQDDILVTTLVKPPYSPYLSDYVGFDSKIVVTLTNKKNTPQSVRLIGQVKGSTGVTVTIPKSFVPAVPIQLAPNQTRMLLGAQLKEYLNPDVLQFAGISKQEVVQGNGLPEGDYSLCLQAVDYGTGVPRSLASPNGCANFTITHYEPPVILQPKCNASVTPKNPQSILFSWTIPAGAPPAKVEYVLKIVEMFPQNIDPNQAMLAATDPPFFEKVISGTSYQYNAANPALEAGRRYAVQVTARNKGLAKDLFFKNDGHSVACSFLYGDGQANNGGNNGGGNNGGKDTADNQQKNDVDEDYADPCTPLNCAPQPPPPATASDKNYQPGDEIKIGYFTLKLTSLSSPVASNLSGEGEIDAPIFHTKLKATFQGLKVNPNNVVYSGKAVGAYDPGAQVDNALKSFAGNLDNNVGGSVKSVTEYVNSHGKFIESFGGEGVQSLPFAWKKVAGNTTELLDIAAVEFTPEGAHFNAFLAMPVPEANNKILAFGQKNICFHPTGLSAGGLQKLAIAGDGFTFPWGEKTTVTLEQAQGNNGTYVKWDCQGYKELQVGGYLSFNNSMIEKAYGNGPVKATFLLSAATWGDILGEVAMDSFYVKGLKGMKLAFAKPVLDFSDTRNPEGMKFPEDYEGSTGKDWRGIYFKEIKMTLPVYLKKNNKPIVVSMKNAVIGKLGFTGGATVKPVMEIGEGGLGGWSFSIEKLELGIKDNALVKGSFEGKLKIPVAKNEIGYTCMLANSEEGVKTTFKVEATDDLDVDMWGAKLALKEGSSISVSAQNDDVTVKAVLNGKLTIDKEFEALKGINVKVSELEFEELTVQNKKPYLSAKHFNFGGSTDRVIAGFPISIDDVQLKTKNDGKSVGVHLAVHVALDGNAQSAISGMTALTIWGAMSDNGGKQSWSPETVSLESIGIKASVASCDIEGKVDIYKGDAKFGDGFRGALTVNFRPIVKLSATVQFGKTKYHSSDPYRYWYVDAMAVLGAGIPVFPGFGIYGFGGGAYYHMKPESAMPTASQLDGDPESNTKFKQDAAGQTNTGAVYGPDPNIAFGFKASIVMGTLPNPKAFNGDITLEASFFNGGGLNELALTGNGYFVQANTPKARPPKESALVAATVAFKYSAEKAAFDGLLDVAINLRAGSKKLIYGGGQASMHFSKDKWFIKLGEPAHRIGLTVLDLAHIDSYFMVGKNSLPGIPPLPTSPINFQQKLPSFKEDNKRSPETNVGSGFALGQELDINTGKLKFLIFYAQLAITFGYDISVLNLDQECQYSEGKMGMNGWYAQGQVYAGVQAAVGLDINLWFLKTQVELFSVGVYAALKAGLPNPTWLKGAVAGEYSALGGLLKGHCDFKFNYGNMCDVGSGDPFGGLKVIAEVKPGGKDANVFSYPEAVYNLPIGKEISVESLNNNGDVVVTTFRFGVKSFEVKNLKTKSPVAGKAELANKNVSSLFTPDDMFDEKTPYRTTVKIYGDKLNKGKWVRIGENNNASQEHLETADQDFTTGDAPETFTNDNIIATLPGRMQRYFHYSSVSKGEIDFNQYPSNIQKLEPKDDDYEYRYLARFQEIGGGSTVVGQSAMAWDPAGKRVTFDLPKGLKKQTIYIAQIVRQRALKPGHKDNTAHGVTATTVNKAIGDQQTIAVKEQRLNSIKLGDDEFMVYQLAFKTSQYGDFSEKWAAFHGEEVTTGKGDYATTIYVRYTGKEPLDWYDVHQTMYMKGSVANYVQPLMRIKVENRASDNGGVSDGAFWSDLANDYLWYLKDTKLNSVLRQECTPNCHTNPMQFREYPKEDAYGIGSRLTSGTSIPEKRFPEDAAAISYEGTGNATKLTNAEINADYQKGLNNGNIKAGFTLKPGDDDGAVAGEKNQEKTVDKMVIRYDAVTTLKHDRKKVYDALVSWAGLNPSASSANSMFQGFLKFNSLKDWDTGKDNPYYFDMHLSHSSSYSFVLSYDYGKVKNTTVKIEAP